MSELKYIASKNGLKYKIVRFEAGSEGKRAKINQKAATVDFTVYPAKFEPNLKLTNEEKYAIRWHMGFTEPKELYGTIGEAYKKYPIALLLNEADLEATYFYNI